MGRTGQAQGPSPGEAAGDPGKPLGRAAAGRPPGAAQGPQHGGNGARAAPWNKVQRRDGRSQRPPSQVCTQENRDTSARDSYTEVHRSISRGSQKVAAAHRWVNRYTEQGHPCNGMLLVLKRNKILRQVTTRMNLKRKGR